MAARRSQQVPEGPGLFGLRRMEVLTLHQSRGARKVPRRGTCGMSFRWRPVKTMTRMTSTWLSLIFPNAPSSVLLVCSPRHLSAPRTFTSCRVFLLSPCCSPPGQLQVTVSMSVGNGQGQLERTIAATVLPAVAHQALLASAILRGDTVYLRKQHTHAHMHAHR